MAETQRKAKSPYQRHKKREISYDNVPLHAGRGLAMTAENVRRWEASILARYGVHPKAARDEARRLMAA